ncbi:MAG: methylated-DNA--[protein]-cysteine S-methyltransferase [Phycisphaerae bacterium]
MRYTIVPTPWGSFGFVSRDGRLLATYLPRGRPELIAAIGGAWPLARLDDGAMPTFRRKLLSYFAGRAVAFTEPIDLTGMPTFYTRVLAACRTIPYGKTASYQDLARATGNPAACRAVGGAMASNPLPLVIPCHRVLRSDGSMGGFSSPRGIDLKKRMLRLEGALAAEPHGRRIAV